MFWTADYAKRRRLVRLLRTNPPLLTWCIRRSRQFLPEPGGSDAHVSPT